MSDPASRDRNRLGRREEMTTGKVVYLYKTDKQTQIKLINIPNIINQTYKYTKDTGKIQSKQTNI